MEMTKKKIIIIALLVVLGLISEFFIAGYASDAKNYKHTVESLDNKKVTVMEITAASAGASALVAAIPGDATTPIANKLADISSYLLIVLTAIFLEKYMITLAGLLAFRILIPLCCVLIITYLFVPKQWMIGISKKLAVLAIAIVLVVPLSVRISDVIENTKDMSQETTVTETVENDSSSNTDIKETIDEENKGFLDSIKDFISDTGDKISNSTSTAIDDAKKTLSNFIEDVAIMLVTACLIPILVFVFLLWFIKILFGINTDNAMPSKLMGKIRDKKGQEQITSEE